MNSFLDTTKKKKNYLLNDVSETIISSRFKPEPPIDDPRFKLRLEKHNRPKSETDLETKQEKIKNLEKVIDKTEKTITELERLSSKTQDQMKEQLQILRTNTTELVKLYNKQRDEYNQEKAASTSSSPRQKRLNSPKRESTKHSTKEEKKEERLTAKEKRKERSSFREKKKKNNLQQRRKRKKNNTRQRWKRKKNNPR